MFVLRTNSLLGRKQERMQNFNPSESSAGTAAGTWIQVLNGLKSLLECARQLEQDGANVLRRHFKEFYLFQADRVQCQRRPDTSGCCAPDFPDTLTPRPLAVNNRRDNYHNACQETCLENGLKICSIRQSNQIWCVCMGNMSS